MWKCKHLGEVFHAHHLSAVIEHGNHKDGHEDDAHPPSAQVMGAENAAGKKTPMSQFLQHPKGSVFPAGTSPVRLHQRTGKSGRQQHEGQLQHTAQPEEDRTRNHSDHCTQHHVLWTGDKDVNGAEGQTDW